MPNSLKFNLSAILIVVLTFFTYSDMLNNDFVTRDTQSYVLDNPHIQGLTWENIQWMLTSFYKSNWHPLTWFSHAVDYALFGLNPRGHHLINLMWHCLNTLGVMVLTLALIKLPTSVRALWTQFDNKALMAAAIAGLWFGIHPQHVESVAWVAERKDVLCLFFTLLTIFCYIFYTTAIEKLRIYWYLATFGSFILALLSKPMAITLPCVLLLMDIYPLQRTTLTIHSRNTVSYGKLLLEKLPFLVLSLFLVIIAIMAQYSGGAIVDTETAAIGIRLLNAAHSYFFYITKWLFPIGLSPFYPFPTYTHFWEYYPSLIPVLAFFLMIFVGGYTWRRQRYYWLSAWLFYVVTLLPVIGIVQIGVQAAADRYAYFPTLPFYILASVWIVDFYSKLSKKYLKVAIIGIAVLLSGILINLTQQQILVWRNDLVFWRYVVLLYPDNHLAQANLANAYYEKGDDEKAIIHYRAAAMVSKFDQIYTNLVFIYLKLNRWQEALEVYQFMLENQIGQKYTDSIHFNMGRIYYEHGNIEQARRSMEQAVAINPHHRAAQDFLAKILSESVIPSVNP